MWNLLIPLHASRTETSRRIGRQFDSPVHCGVLADPLRRVREAKICIFPTFAASTIGTGLCSRSHLHTAASCAWKSYRCLCQHTRKDRSTSQLHWDISPFRRRVARLTAHDPCPSRTAADGAADHGQGVRPRSELDSRCSI